MAATELKEYNSEEGFKNLKISEDNNPSDDEFAIGDDDEPVLMEANDQKPLVEDSPTNFIRFNNSEDSKNDKLDDGMHFL